MKADDFLSVGLANAVRCNPGISSFDCVESDKNAVLKKVTVVNMPEDTEFGAETGALIQEEMQFIAGSFL